MTYRRYCGYSGISFRSVTKGFFFNFLVGRGLYVYTWNGREVCASLRQMR